MIDTVIFDVGGVLANYEQKTYFMHLGYILSNFAKTALLDCADALDFRQYCDDCFFSCEHKVIKPDPAAFLTLFYLFHIDPCHAVFIDDTLPNIISARQFGLHGIRYQSQMQAEAELEKLLMMEND